MKKTKKQHSYQSYATPVGNTIWSAVMPLVWNEARQTLTNNDPLQFKNPTKIAQSIIKAFNNSQITPSIISSDSYYGKCGFGQKTIALINKEVKKRFKGMKLELKERLEDDDFISYAYIYKSLIFLNKFQRRKEGIFRFNDRPCESFYAKHFEQKQQIKCYFYEDRANFIIKVRLKQDSSQLFLIKNRKIKTVKAAISTVESSIDNKQSFTLSKKDKFEMPFISINAIRKYEQMEGLQFKNQGIEGYRIKRMYQQLKLQINECGAILEAQGVLVAFKCPLMGGNQPKEFLLDESFWILLKQEKQSPYFCAYIQHLDEK